MHRMAIDRRTVLKGLGAAAALLPEQARATESSPCFVGAYRTPDGVSGTALMNGDGRVIRTIALPDRGHDATVSTATGDCVVFARRPGNFAVAFSTRNNREPRRFTTVQGRHFYGHGLFSKDGRLLYATENAYEEGSGRIGVYDVRAGYRRIGEFPSHGIGPHDIAALPGEPVLVVANGGAREHPDIGDGREILNAAALEPSIAYIDARSGDLVELHRPHAVSGSLSLRHLDVASDGTVVVGCQAENGDARDPLIFRHRRQRQLTAITLELDPDFLFRGYISSVAIDRNGECAALTSSRSGIAAVIQISTGRILRRMHLADVSGVAATTDGSFAYAAGTGDVAVELAGAKTTRVRTAIGWDNHLTCVPATMTRSGGRPTA